MHDREIPDTLDDAGQPHVPFLNLFEIDDRLIRGYRIHADASTRYAG